MNNKFVQALARVLVAALILTVCFFAVKKLVTNYVDENGTSVGGSPTETSRNTAEEVTESAEEKIKKLGAEEYVRQYARKNNIDFSEYPDYIIELLDKNPAAVDFVLEYPTESKVKHKIDMSEYKNQKSVPLFIQWDKRWGYIKYGSSVAGISACGPVSLSMVAYYLTKDENMSPDKIIKFAKDNGYCVPGNGTLWSLISEGGKKLGLKVKELSPAENTVRQNLEKGNPIICIMGPGDFTTIGHYIVLTGYEDGYVTVNDSNSYVRSAKKWKFSEIKDQIKNLWALSK